MDDRGKNTRVVLGLARNRIAGLLLRGLWSVPRYREEYVALLQESKGETEFPNGIGPLVIRAAKSSDLILTNAYGDEPVSSEFGNIIWAELSDQLIANGSCEFANFGTFHRSLSSLGLTVGFEPNRLLIDPGTQRRTNLQSLSPASDRSRPAAGAIEPRNRPAAEVILADLCLNFVESAVRSSMEGHKASDFGHRPKSSPQLAGTWLYGTLPSLIDRIASEFVTNEKARSGIDNGLTFMAMGLAFGAYYLWFLAFAVELSTGAKLAIPSIGVFHLTEKTSGIVSKGQHEKTVVFEAEADFRKLISVSLPPAPAKAA
jgi:hypothetical protein